MHWVWVDAALWGAFIDPQGALLGTMDLPKSTPSSLGHEDVLLKYNCIYHHKLMHINYITYDAHQAQDTINIGTTQWDIMVLHSSSPEHLINCPEHAITPPPYLYAQVLGIFHVNAIYAGAPHYTTTLQGLICCGWDGFTQFCQEVGKHTSWRPSPFHLWQATGHSVS